MTKFIKKAIPATVVITVLATSPVIAETSWDVTQDGNLIELPNSEKAFEEAIKSNNIVGLTTTPDIQTYSKTVQLPQRCLVIDPTPDWCLDLMLEWAEQHYSTVINETKFIQCLKSLRKPSVCHAISNSIPDDQIEIPPIPRKGIVFPLKTAPL